MAHHFNVDMRAFEIESEAYNLVLSVTSKAFIEDVQIDNLTVEDVIVLIKSKKLWMLPRGCSQLDILVQLSEVDMDNEAEFLDFLADAICQYSLWTALGLTVENVQIQYYPENDESPNLCFGIEPSDMSFALLQPPHSHTAYLKGLECVLRLKATKASNILDRNNENLSCDTLLSSSLLFTHTQIHSKEDERLDSDKTERWEFVSYLVEAALCYMIGLRRRFEDLRVRSSTTSSTMSWLEVAPHIWNNHYLELAKSHSDKFSVISECLATGSSAESRDTISKHMLAEESVSQLQANEPNTDGIERCVERKLWDLLQSALEPNVGVKRSLKDAAPANILHSPSQLSFDGYEDSYGTIDSNIPHPTSYDSHESADWSPMESNSTCDHHDHSIHAFSNVGYDTGNEGLPPVDDEVYRVFDAEYSEHYSFERMEIGRVDNEQLETDEPCGTLDSEDLMSNPMVDQDVKAILRSWSAPSITNVLDWEPDLPRLHHTLDSDEDIDDRMSQSSATITDGDLGTKD
ncbi:hypothetical protein F5Y18DRAFT_437507 [Xylariaceae sp. FL1019]|nr:hypothetical protein F5Y18DRAFT_437507 [Xylariaceae sp. FL1019]